MTEPGEIDETTADAAKDRFRAALERKKGRHHPHESAAQQDPKLNDPRGAAGGRRLHRRKSG